MRIPLLVLSFVLCSQFAFTQNDDGPFKDYFNNGELKTEGQYFNNKRIGVWKDYFDNNQLRRLYSYERGKRSKVNETYYKNGTLRSKTQKKSDYYLAKGYYESGELEFERILENGYYKEFLKNGKLIIKSNYTDYRLAGLWNRYYESGQLEWSVVYEDGYRNGNYKKYYENGQLQLDGKIIKEKLEGNEKRYANDGVLIWEGYYKNGVFHKTWMQFDSVGTKLVKIKYKEGVLLKNQEESGLTPTKVPEGLLERVPVYSGCEEALGNSAKKKCMSKKISRFVATKFNTDLALTLKLTGTQKIKVRFKIDKTGAVTEVKARAQHPKLEEEAIRVIKLLPLMKPGWQRGKAVVVPYALPIVFQLK